MIGNLLQYYYPIKLITASSRGKNRAWCTHVQNSFQKILRKTATLYYYTTKIFFRWSFFLYSPCPYLEGIKDALCYKFRRPMIGQNCSAVCTNKGGHRDTFSNKRREVPHVSRDLLSTPLSLKQSERWGFDSMFEQSENIAIAVASSSSCCWPALRGVVYAILGSKFMLLHAHCKILHYSKIHSSINWQERVYPYTLSCQCYLGNEGLKWCAGTEKSMPG